MSLLIDLWLLSLVLLWLALVRGSWTWGRGFSLPITPTKTSQSVRVVVPARNEVDNIRPCIEAVLASQGIELELVVADDGSTDGTPVVALSAGEGDERFRLLDVPELPAGWAGKCWACQQAARGAGTDWLLFVDADVRVSPHAIASAVMRGQANRADLLSLFGTWELESFWELVVVPAVGWFVRGAADVPKVNSGHKAFANGQFLLMRREAWEELGGHEAVADAVLDDVGMAEASRVAGQRVWLLWSPDAFQVRLYTSLGQIVAGYRKNMYEGTGRRPLVALIGAISVLLTTVLPPLAALGFWAAAMPRRALAALAVSLLIVLWRFVVERIDGRSGVVAPLHFLGAALLAWILLVSMTSRTVSWKGRSFDGGRAR